jgi:hypothetical protein
MKFSGVRIMKRYPRIFPVIIFLCLSAIFFISSCEREASDRTEVDSFTFAVLGDRTQGHYPGVFKEIVMQINQLKPDLVLNIGDVIEGYSDDKKLLDEQWKEYKAIHELVKAPYFYTTGNHDISPGHDKLMLPLFRQYLGEPQYTFTHKNTYFVMFDSSIWVTYEELPESQWKWLEDALARKPKADHILVFMHRPYWMDYIGSDKPDRMHDLFKKYKATAVFAGHHHYYCSAEYDGILYTEIGSSGGKLFNGVIEDEGKFFHFLFGMVKGQEIRLGIVKKDDPDNTILPWDSVTWAYAKQKFRMKKEGIHLPPVEVEDGKKLSIPDYAVKIHNKLENAMDTRLTWLSEGNWNIDPLNLPLKLNSGDAVELSFSLTQTGSIFPLPRVSLPLMIGQNKPTSIETKMTISRKLECPRLDRAPAIDGQKEELWEKAMKISTFCEKDGTPSGAEETHFYFGYDDNALYILVEAFESQMDKLVVTGKERDQDLGDDDHARFLFVPEIKPEEEDVILYQVYINTHPSIFDISYLTDKESAEIKKEELEWDGDTKVKVTKHKNGWMMEIAIAASSLGVEKINSGDEWKLNFRRKQQSNKTTADWQPNLSRDWREQGTMVFE